MKHRIMGGVVWIVCSTLGLALAACGSDDSNAPTDLSTADTTGEEPDLAPVPPECTPQFAQRCQNGAMYWVDGCGQVQQQISACDCGCAAGNAACLTCNCTPDCTGKSCGDDGCGGQCQPGCGAGTSCDAGTFQCIGCSPSCDGKQCGDDGCGGTCAPGCTQPATCDEGLGQCVSPCIPDCSGRQCGDNGCGGSCGSCGGGMSCNAATYQCEGSCQPSCVGKYCGDDGCGGSCGGCAEKMACNTNSMCEATCTPNCAGKVCGSDDCIGQCGPGCADGSTCSEDGTQCVVTCGNGVQDPGEQCEPAFMPASLPCSGVLMHGEAQVTCDANCRLDFQGCTCSGGGDCGIPLGGGGCLFCAVQTVCRDLVEECMADSACNGWLQCLGNCPSTGCADICDDYYASEKPKYDAVRRCIYCACGEECQFPAVNCL